MSRILDRLDAKKAKDLRVLSGFVSIFCRKNHQAEDKEAFHINDSRLHQILNNGDNNLMLCPDCSKLLKHGMVKLLLCPYDPKPMCKKCETHCYAPGYRKKMREVMKFSGLYLIRHGRLDLIFHYLF